MAQRKKAPIITSPQGIAVFPHVTKPDTHFDAEGEYNIKLKLPEDEAQELKKMVDEANAQAVAEAKKARQAAGLKGKKVTIKNEFIPYDEEEDDEGDPTGNLLFRFKQNAVIKKKDGTRTPAKVNIFDAKGKPFKPEYIGGGSVVKVAFQVIPYGVDTPLSIGTGITLRLRAVQVLDLVTGGGDASSFGFDEEDGFDADEYDGPELNDEKQEGSNPDDGFDGPEDDDIPF